MKLKIMKMKNLPEVPDAEIRKYMDFEQLVRKHAIVTRTSYLIKAGIGLSAALVVCLSAYYFTRNQVPTNG